MTKSHPNATKTFKATALATLVLTLAACGSSQTQQLYEKHKDCYNTGMTAYALGVYAGVGGEELSDLQRGNREIAGRAITLGQALGKSRREVIDDLTDDTVTQSESIAAANPAQLSASLVEKMRKCEAMLTT